ncbi:MAG: DUF6493 family protein [Planctomycetota bacterium]
MTYEELEALVAQGKPWAVAEALAPLSEAQRKKLSVKTGKLFKTFRVDIQGFGLDTKEQKEIRKRVMSIAPKKFNRQIVFCAVYAALGVCPLSVVKDIEFQGNLNEMKAKGVVKILADRRPDWADQWLASLISNEWDAIPWGLLRELITRKICNKPRSEGYARYFTDHVYNVWDEDRPEGKTRSQIIREAADLLEDVWLLFEHETDAFTYDWGEPSWVDGRPEYYESWPETIINLMNSGDLSRDRLLDQTLASALLGFKTSAQSGFTRLHAMLEPTGEEMAVRQQAYLDLLSCQTGAVVTFAVKMIKQVDKNKRLDAAAFLASASRVFSLPSKGQPKSILALTKTLLKKKPEHRAAGIDLAFDGLMHADSDVQAKALDLISTYSEDARPSTADRLSAIVEELPATLHSQASEALQRLGASRADFQSGLQAGETDQEEDTEVRIAELRTRAGSLSPALREMHGIDAALEAIETGCPTPPLPFSIMDAPLLSTLEPIDPIQTADELLDAVAHAIEKVDSADEIERIIDGISRLCDQRTDDFDARFAPMIKRLCPPEDEWWDGEIFQNFAPSDLPSLVLAWHEPEHSYRFYTRRDAGAIRFMRMRIQETEAWVRARQPRVLLSSPTHRGGWIDPRVFVQRLIDLQQADVSPGRCDLILALLRLTPDGRADALAMASKLADRAEADAVRYALGGELVEETVKQQISKGGSKAVMSEDVGLWLAAGRCREPFETLKALEELGLRVHRLGGTERVMPRFKACIKKYREYSQDRVDHTIKIECEPAYKTNPDVPINHRVTSFIYYNCLSVGLTSRDHWVVDWCNSCWPMNNDPALLIAIEGMIERIDMKSSTESPNYAYLQGLFLSDRPWNQIANVAVWIAFAGKDNDVRGLASDALVEAIDDGRANVEAMGDALALLAPNDAPGWLRLNRLVPSLEELAMVSDAHNWFVAHCLQRLVDAWDSPPRDAYHALGVLLECMARIGLALDEPSRNSLSVLKGSGKSAKLAKLLLKLEKKPDNPAILKLNARLAEARIERAERWAGPSTTRSRSGN